MSHFIARHIAGRELAAEYASLGWQVRYYACRGDDLECFIVTWRCCK